MSVRWLVLCLLLGCSLDRAAESAPASISAPAPPRGAGADGSKAGSAPDLTVERMVIREASVRLRAADPRKTAEAATRIAREMGGFVLGSQLHAVDAHASAIELQLRVPQAALEATLARVRKLGSVLVEEVEGQDVTEEFVDVSGRLRAQRTLEARLLTLLERSAELKDLLLVEQELSRVRSEVEQREGRLAYLRERSRMAAIRLVAEAPEQPLVASVQTLGSRFANAFGRSSELALSVTLGGIEVAGAMLPIGLLGLAIVLPVRRLRRRRLARAAA